MRVHFYINRWGHPDSDVFDTNPIFATFLTNEIGFTPSSANFWTEEIKKGLADPTYSHDTGIGNAHELIVTGPHVKLFDEFVLQDHEVECSGEQLLELIELWLAFLKDRQERNITLPW